MLHNVISLLGLLAALPAIILTIRVIAKLLISLIFNKEKVTVTYHSENGEKYEKKLYLKKNDDLLNILDDIARKSRHEGKSHG
ncbi:hypothetical protein ACT35X_002491 [Enterobacter hormaechei]|uniref:hypothetical protein n=1 Tax=Enterobacter cloacae complex TaxID=354276 RepID=UPI0005ED6336|nr:MULTISPECIES: hypothetical protein [Enterobacter cloacae complex]HCA3448017.1 hypothetical protein [Salmonella enterica subsp. enterica serovar Gallinarum]HCM9551166.1 hypothetical protein [Enterobacter hormaechei subsp. xiangfangensis]HCR2229438.1 hypothetical protein [Enterobacter cloacae subsp. cloacae]HEC5276444.1 hypothetical protein [Enterobacter cloacae]KJP22935.1 hypothetical protein SR74_00985 [Enterobacter asburiae]